MLFVLGALIVINLATSFYLVIKNNQITKAVNEVNAELPACIDNLWDNKLTQSLDQLTSEETLAEALAKMPESQLDRLSVKVYEKRAR